MFTIRWVACVVSVGLLAGCAQQKPVAAPPPPPPVPSATVTVEQAKSDFKLSNPQAMVWDVRGVMPARNMVAIKDLPDQSVTRDEPISIVSGDAKYTLVAKGSVD